MNKSERTLLSFALGAVAGLAAGLLFAPAKGENTRKRISSKAGELKDELKENLDREKLRNLANSALSGVEKYGQRLTESVKN